MRAGVSLRGGTCSTRAPASCKSRTRRSRHRIASAAAPRWLLPLLLPREDLVEFLVVLQRPMGIMRVPRGAREAAIVVIHVLRQAKPLEGLGRYVVLVRPNRDSLKQGMENTRVLPGQPYGTMVLR